MRGEISGGRFVLRLNRGVRVRVRLRVPTRAGTPDPTLNIVAPTSTWSPGSVVRPEPWALRPQGREQS